MTTRSDTGSNLTVPATGRGLPLVIGYGNPLRADDGVGWQVAQRLADILPPDAATVIAAHQLTPELAEPISRAGLVVFVDAAADGEPGQVASRPVLLPADSALTFSHDVEPSTLLELAGALYGAGPPGVVISVAGADFGYGHDLSDVVRAALPSVFVHVRAALAGALPSSTSPIGPPGGHHA